MTAPSSGVAAQAATVSEDGKWFWDGSRWSARHATITGSVIPRILAWTIVGALPLGALVALPIGLLLAKINTVVTVGGIVIVLVAAEALMATWWFARPRA